MPVWATAAGASNAGAQLASDTPRASAPRDFAYLLWQERISREHASMGNLQLVVISDSQTYSQA